MKLRKKKEKISLAETWADALLNLLFLQQSLNPLVLLEPFTIPTASMEKSLLLRHLIR